MKILDCTLRDGGYYNNWNFSNDEISEYFNFIKKNPIDIVEIGFRFLKKNKFYGPYAFSSENFINNLNLPKNKKYSVMINAKDYYDDEELIDEYFLKKKQSRIDIVRIAINYQHFDRAENIAAKLKNIGYEIGLNLMQANNIDQKFAKKNFQIIKSWKTVNVLYFADSLGCMNPSEIENLTNLFLDYWGSECGIHAHNNKGLALLNTLSALNKGVKWVDSTILGMGRGAGNVSTESFLIENEKKLYPKKIYFENLSSFQKLKNKYNWGYNPYYHFSALHKIHPTYVQTLIDDERYNKGNIFNYLKTLSTQKTSIFNENLLNGEFEDLYNYDYKGDSLINNFKKISEILIIGNGPSVQDYKQYIEEFIKESKMICFHLNTNNRIDIKLINAFVISHISRVNIEIENILNLKKKIILPPSILKKFNIPNKHSMSYGIKIKKNSFKSYDRYCELPSPLVLNYVLQILKQLKVKNIFLAGIDGYDDEKKNKEIYDGLLNFKEHKKNLSLKTITPSKFDILAPHIIY